ncbi:MAG: flippase [Patescibacteria group bacterium]
MSKISSRIKEKWAEVGFQKYLQNTGWMFVARILGMGIAFFVTAIVARYLGPGNYGTLMYAVSFVSLFSFIASLGIDQILYREILKSPEKEPELLGTSLLLRLAGGFVAFIAASLCAFIFLENPLEQMLIYIISISFVFQASNVLNYTFLSRLKNRNLSIIMIVITVILSLLKIGIVSSNKGILFLSAVFVIEPILYALFFIFYYSKFFGKLREWTFSVTTAKTIIKHSLPLMFSSVFALIYSRIDQIMLNSYIDSTAVGLYSSAVTLSEVWYFIPGIIVATLFPSIMNAKQTDEHMYSQRILKLTAFLVIISSVIGLVGSVFAKPILNLVFGVNFVAAYQVLQLYIWAGVGISVGTVIIQFLVAEHLSRAVLYISIIGMVINILLNIVLIPTYGIAGAAFATLVSYTLGPISVLCLNEPRRKILRLFRA